jgi:rSAM/selenodomain-associated transferase 1
MQAPSNRTVVALFVRVPVPGQVKTRLAGGLGAEGACMLYQAMVADTLRNLQACGFPLYLFYDPTGQDGLPPAWVAAAARVVAQQGEGIGERMASAFEHCFYENIQQVVLVGSDIPGLDAGDIREAAAALASNDAAITPVVDGGYCLIALQRERYQRRVFEEIPWSTGQVLRVTLERFAECSLSVFLHRALQDIDTMDDLQRYAQKPSAQALATNRVIALLRKGSFGGV